MKVYIAKSQWVNDDGWPISDAHDIGAYSTREKADAAIMEDKAEKLALGATASYNYWVSEKWVE